MGREVTPKISFSIHGKYYWCGFMLLPHGISCLRLWLCSLVVVVLFFFSFLSFEIQELSNSMPWSCQVMMSNGQCLQTSPLKPAELRRWVIAQVQSIPGCYDDIKGVNKYLFTNTEQ